MRIIGQNYIRLCIGLLSSHDSAQLHKHVRVFPAARVVWKGHYPHFTTKQWSFWRCPRSHTATQQQKGAILLYSCCLWEIVGEKLEVWGPLPQHAVEQRVPLGPHLQHQTTSVLEPTENKMQKAEQLSWDGREEVVKL